MLKRICVFCGSSDGGRPAYTEAAEALGAALADRGQTLVYGGARVGLMGAVARAALDAGGDVIGVMPRGIVEREVAYERLTDLRVVRDMAERKALMDQLSDGFVALPGGFGTLDELSEMLVAAQLGWHAKPMGLLNVAGYYDGALAWIARAVEDGFIPARHAELLHVAPRPDALLDALDAAERA